MKRPRIPKQHRFPFGFTVPTNYQHVRGADGQFLLEKQWQGPRIDVDSRNPLWKQIEAYAHEMVHAAIDFNRFVLQEIVEPMKTEAEESAKALKEAEKE